MRRELKNKVLKHLRINSRKTLSAIAREEGLAVSTVFEVLRELRLDGVIERFFPVIDFANLGFPFKSFVIVDFSFQNDKPNNELNKPLSINTSKRLRKRFRRQIKLNNDALNSRKELIRLIADYYLNNIILFNKGFVLFEVLFSNPVEENDFLELLSSFNNDYYSYFRVVDSLAEEKWVP